MSNTPCGENLLCQCYSYGKKNLKIEFAEVLGLLFHLIFLGNMLFSPRFLSFFFFSRNVLYLKAWTNGPSRCLGHLGAHLFICVGPIRLSAVCEPQILHTLGRNIFPFVLPCLSLWSQWIITGAWRGSRFAVSSLTPGCLLVSVNRRASLIKKQFAGE